MHTRRPYAGAVYCLLPPNYRLLPPNHCLLPPNHCLPPPNHRLLPPNKTQAAVKSWRKRTCKGQNCSYASANGKDAAHRKREAPPKETTGKRPCEAGRCKSICQGLSSVTAYFYFFIATFALRQWAVQILHRRVPTALRPMARRPVVETTLQPTGRTSAGSISVRNINKKTGRALKRKTRWNGTNFYQTDASVRNT